MPKTEPVTQLPPHLQNLAPEELKSVTHGDFWIPEQEREFYKVALQALNEAGVPYVVAGAYAIYEHTGIYRKTKDLDLFCEPGAVVQAMEVLKRCGFRARLEQSHWLAKSLHGELFIDVIYGMGNGLALIDPDWFAHSTPAILAATDVRVAPAEELIWHRLFISERHRHDMADIVHLILKLGHQMDWERLVAKTGRNWPLLLSQLQLFRYVYPGHAGQVPEEVVRGLLARAGQDLDGPAPADDADLTRGTLISRFSFAIDVNEWGFRDVREELIQRMKASAPIQAIVKSGVWDERAPDNNDSSVPRDEDAMEAEAVDAAGGEG
jgi:hypothetical protein